MTTAAIYTRISQDATGQQLGVTRQLEDCTALANSLGWDIAAHYDDNDLSAFNGKKRPGFEAMLTDMAEGKFDALIVWHTDRLYRSMKDLLRLIEIADAHRINIKTVQGGDLDLSTSAGRMVAKILGSVAEQENEHKGERQKRANAQKATAGKWLTANRPFGYTQQGIPLEPEAQMIRDAAADVLAGKSIKQLTREWNAAGIVGTRGHKFTAPNVRRLLVNPRYAALNVHNGKVVGPGQWEAILDMDTHKGLVAYLSDPSRVRCTKFEKKYMGSGVYFCGVCGATLRHAVAGGRNANQRKYECSENNAHVVISGGPLDEYVDVTTLTLLQSTDLSKRLGLVNDDIDTESLHTQRAALQARMDELASLFAEGVIDASQLRSGTNKFRTQAAGIDKLLADAVRTSPAAKLLAAGPDVTKAWYASSPDIRGKIIAELWTVTIHKATKKGPWFDYDRVNMEPKH
jgi:site-specific DNA recombinase